LACYFFSESLIMPKASGHAFGSFRLWILINYPYICLVTPESILGLEPVKITEVISLLLIRQLTDFV